MAKVKNSVLRIKIDSPQLGLSRRVANVLESNNILTLGALVNASCQKLGLLKGFGPCAEQDVKDVLAKFDLHLKDDPAPYHVAKPCPLCGHRRET